jgi:hypothetical protein
VAVVADHMDLEMEELLDQEAVELVLILLLKVVMELQTSVVVVVVLVLRQALFARDQVVQV